MLAFLRYTQFLKQRGRFHKTFPFMLHKSHTIYAVGFGHSSSSFNGLQTYATMERSTLLQNWKPLYIFRCVGTCRRSRFLFMLRKSWNRIGAEYVCMYVHALGCKSYPFIYCFSRELYMFGKLNRV